MTRVHRPAAQLLLLVATVTALSICRVAGGEDAKAGTPPSWESLRAMAGDAARRPGVCIVIGADTGTLCAEIAANSKLLVFALTPDDPTCKGVRDALDKAGIGSTRAAAMARTSKGLPFPKGYGNVVMAIEPVSAPETEEISRVLNPNGVAIIGGGTDGASIEKALQDANVKGYRKVTAGGAYAVIGGAMPEGSDDWSCWRHGADGNAVSSEKAIRPPFRTQWISDEPAVSNGAAFGEMTLVAQGRLIIKAGVGKLRRPGAKEADLYAKDAFNGVGLWQRRLDGVGSSDRNVTAVGDRLYVIGDGRKVFVLDAATGRDIKQFEWSEKDGISGQLMNLFVVGDAGYVQASGGAPATAPLRGDTLFAFRITDGGIIWKYTCEPPAFGASIVLGGGALYYHAAGGEAVALDLATGKERWRNKDGLKALGTNVGTVSGNYSMYARDRVIFWGGRSGKAFALDAAKGTPAWESAASGGRPMFLVGDRLYTYPKHTHEFFADRKYLIHAIDPAAGNEIEAFEAWMPGCGAGTASGSTIFSSGAYFNSYDIEAKRAMSNSGFFRSNCGEGMVVGNGLVFSPPFKCTCNYSMHGSIALGPAKDWVAPDGGKDAAGRFTRGPAFDKHLAAAGQDDDWACAHHDVKHSADSKAELQLPLAIGWQQTLRGKLTPPITGGGQVYVASAEGYVWALDAASGEVRWRFRCGGEIHIAPTYWRGRVLAGCDDGRVYCLDAGSGQLAWTFRAAPEDQFTQVAGKITSAWPVQSGVALKDDGTAFFAAGRCAYDGAYLYAIDAAEAEVKWVQQVGRLNDRGEGINPDGAIALDEQWIYVPTGARPAVFRQSDGKLVRMITLLDRKTRMPGGAMANYSNWEWCGGTDVMIAGDMMLYGGARRIGGAGYDYVVADTKTGYAYGTREALAAGTLKPAKDNLWREYTLPSNGGLWMPLLSEEGVYSIRPGDSVIAYDRQKMAALPMVAVGQLGSAAEDATRWKVDGPTGACSLIAAGKVVLASGETEVWALSRKDGAKVGTVQLPGKVSPRTLAAAGGRAYVVGNSAEGEETLFCLVK
ncbi:MAG: PQQ-binding-like beta-propeller repeat protein [Phycisphaerae bacterium]